MRFFGIRILVGEHRLRAMRVAQNFVLVSSVSSILTLFTVKDWSWWWGLAIVPMFALMYWLDPRVVRGETTYINDNNPQFQELCGRVKNIESRMQ